RGIRDSVDPGRAKMALERGHHLFRRRIVNACDLKGISIEREHGLQRLDRRPAFTHAKKTTAANRLRLDEMTYPSGRQTVPGELLARVALAVRCNVRVSKDSFRTNAVSSANVARQRDDGLDLRVGKIGIAMIMATIG